MPKGPSGEKRPADVVGCAIHVAKIATGEREEATYQTPKRDQAGRAGGLTRANALTPEKRSEIAAKAADARWR